jgi:hypothetical protein
MQGKRGANALCCACHTDRGGRSRAPTYVLCEVEPFDPLMCSGVGGRPRKRGVEGIHGSLRRTVTLVTPLAPLPPGRGAELEHDMTPSFIFAATRLRRSAHPRIASFYEAEPFDPRSRAVAAPLRSPAGDTVERSHGDAAHWVVPAHLPPCGRTFTPWTPPQDRRAAPH